MYSIRKKHREIVCFYILPQNAMTKLCGTQLRRRLFLRAIQSLPDVPDIWFPAMFGLTLTMLRNWCLRAVTAFDTVDACNKRRKDANIAWAILKGLPRKIVLQNSEYEFYQCHRNIGNSSHLLRSVNHKSICFGAWIPRRDTMKSECSIKTKNELLALRGRTVQFKPFANRVFCFTNIAKRRTRRAHTKRESFIATKLNT